MFKTLSGSHEQIPSEVEDILKQVDGYNDIVFLIAYNLQQERTFVAIAGSGNDYGENYNYGYDNYDYNYNYTRRVPHLPYYKLIFFVVLQHQLNKNNSKLLNRFIIS
jgi:hypothetical protein